MGKLSRNPRFGRTDKKSALGAKSAVVWARNVQNHRHADIGLARL